jgi:hypothetical protein
MTKKESRGDDNRDLYLLAVEMADRISSRRLTANSFYLILEASLVALGSTSFISSGVGGEWKQLASSVVGVAVSAVWWLALKSYRDLNRAKFQVITAMESKMATRLFSEEWTILKADPVESWRSRYAELGTAERVVPVIFACLYAFQTVMGFVLGP